jgi:hypothetical protein
MAQPIYKLFLGKMTEAWHQLPADEQHALLAKVNRAGTGGGPWLV